MNSTTTLLAKPIYNSTASLSSRVTDIANVFVLPPICVFGIVLNIFCIIVVSRKELSGELYTFILFHSICDLIFLVINVFTCIVRCGVYCAYGYAFLSKVWELYIHLFTGNSFLLFGTGLDIVVAFNRLFSFSSTQPKLVDRFNKIDLKVKCLVLAILSALANTPSYIITRNVQLIGYLESTGINSTDLSFQPLYQALTNALGKSEPMIVFLFVLTLFRGVIPLFALFFINLVIAYRFKMHVKKKRKIVPIAHTTTNTGIRTSEQKANRKVEKKAKSEQNVTKMVLIMCGFFLIGNVPNAISPILFTLNVNSLIYSNYVIFGNFMLLISRGSYFFIYYFFNNSFRSVFNSVLKIAFRVKPDSQQKLTQKVSISQTAVN